MDKYIVYKTGSGLGPQSVRKSSIIEVRVIDSIHGPPPLGWMFLSWEWWCVGFKDPHAGKAAPNQDQKALSVLVTL